MSTSDIINTLLIKSSDYDYGSLLRDYIIEIQNQHFSRFVTSN